jgi:hypothetical protein
MYSIESQPTFRRNESSPAEGSKNVPSKKLALKQVEIRAGLLLRLFSDPEAGDDIFLRNVG